MFPTLHLNGTGSKALLDSNEAVRDALRALQSAMRDDAPNARDYIFVDDPQAGCVCALRVPRGVSLAGLFVETVSDLHTTAVNGR